MYLTLVSKFFHSLPPPSTEISQSAYNLLIVKKKACDHSSLSDVPAKRAILYYALKNTTIIIVTLYSKHRKTSMIIPVI